MEGEDIRFAHLSSEQGLRLNRVNHIAQDDQGFLWFGASDGLRRYDGYRFREFRHDPGNPNSLSGAFVGALFKDRSGTLWIGADEFLDRYDPATETFRHYRPVAGEACGPEGTVYHIGQDRQGMIWLSTDSGLKRLDPATSRITCYRHKQEDNSSLASNLVRSTLESKDGTFWVATTEGLDIFDRETGKVTRHVSLQGPSGSPLKLAGTPMSLFEDHLGVLWIAFIAGEGLASFDPAAGLLAVYSFSAGEFNENGLSGVQAILEDGSGTMWFATNGRGLLKLDRVAKRAYRYQHHPNDPESLSENHIAGALFEDREHRIWVGTKDGGIDRFDPIPPPFRTFRYEPGNPNSLANDTVFCVYQDSRGMLWVGTRDTLNRIDRKSGQVTRYQSAASGSTLSSAEVLSIAEDRTGYVWFGTRAGLNRFDPRSGRFKTYRHQRLDPNSLSQDFVYSLLVDNRGTLWAGTEDALNRFDAATDQFQTYRPSVQGLSRYHSITEDSSGALWLGSLGNGLHRFDPVTSQFTVYKNTPGDARSLSNDRVNSVHIDHAGTVWAGTSEGLSRLDPASHEFTVFHVRDGLPGNAVMSILEDAGGDLWLGTSDGLSRFHPPTKTFKNYYVSDGLPGNEFSPFVAASKGPGGEMFFGTFSGLTAFFPDRVVDSPSVPPVVLTDFQLFGSRASVGGDSPLKQSISFTRSLILSHRQNTFSFEFSALSYSDPSRNRYRHKLEGFEKHWQETDSTRRFVSYTTLAPGEYVFRVQGSDSHGNWNEQGVDVQISIQPPWWSTWWFRGGITVIALAVVVGGYRWRVGDLKERERQFRTLAEHAPDSIMRIGPDLRYQYVNPVLCEYLELPREAILGKTPRDLGVPENQMQPWDAAVRLVFQTGQPIVQEFEFVPPRGLLNVEARLVPERDDGHIRSVLIILRDITARKRAEEELRTAHDRLTRELDERTKADREIRDLGQRLIHAQEEERGRIARELHDDVSQQIGALSIGLSNLKAQISAHRPNATEEADRLHQRLVKLSSSVRHLSHDLHPVLLEHGGIGVALQSYCGEFSSLSGLSVSFQAGGAFDEVSAEAALCLYRVAQEALQNVAKHAATSEAYVHLAGANGNIHLIVSDRGVGFDLERARASGGLGLVSIKERVELVKGTLTVESEPGVGTTIRADVPVGSGSPAAGASNFKT